MKKILSSLRNSGEPLSVEEISEESGLSSSEVRRHLYRLQEEGKVESKEEQGKLKWTIKSSDPVEEKYEKMTRENR